MADKIYLALMKDILENGIESKDRTGTGTISVFGQQARYDLTKGFPLLTTKKINFKNVATELLWFISGDTNIKYLQEHKNPIWNEWADENGELGRVYGKQWREFRGWKQRDDGSIEHFSVDQISNVIEQIKTNPESRRHIVVAFNPADVSDMKLPPCHAFFQFYVRDGRLSCQLYQRSSDGFLGNPYNVASYSLLTHMVAQVCNLEVGEFIHTLGDSHIYLNHLEQINLQMSREPKPLPTLKLNKNIKNIFDFTLDDIELIGYDPHPFIKGLVSV